MNLRPPNLIVSTGCCLGAALLLAACNPTSASQLVATTPVASPTLPPAAHGSAAGPQVVIDNFAFSPQTITVTVGTTVTWVNNDDTAHTVVSTDKVFSSAAMDTGDQYTFRFGAPGTYNYFCMIHPKMTAAVIVQ